MLEINRKPLDKRTHHFQLYSMVPLNIPRSIANSEQVCVEWYLVSHKSMTKLCRLALPFNGLIAFQI